MQHGCKITPNASFPSSSGSHIPQHRRQFLNHDLTKTRNPPSYPSLITASSSSNNDTTLENLTPYQGAPIPTRMNNVPHPREMRRYFYSEITTAVMAGLHAGNTRLDVRCTIPELNTEFDVYRVGTLLEMVRDVACAVAADGKKVKVCVQQPLGQGVFQGTPLSLSGVMRIMQQMDWGEAKEFISLGNLGAAEVNGSKEGNALGGGSPESNNNNDSEKENEKSSSGNGSGADVFVLISPQNLTGNSVLPLLEEMTQEADKLGKSIILINAKLGDVPSSSGIMGVRGRQDRQDFIKTFTPAYHFRLLYLGAGPYPIMGALRYTYGGPWEVLKRVDFIEKETGKKEEAYQIVGRFLEKQPGAAEITECFQKKKKQS
jgi:adenylate kinase